MAERYPWVDCEPKMDGFHIYNVQLGERVSRRLTHGEARQLFAQLGGYLDSLVTAKDTAPAPGAEAAIEVLLKTPRHTLRVWRHRDGFEVEVSDMDDRHECREARGPTLSAALAALRGEAKNV